MSDLLDKTMADAAEKIMKHYTEDAFYKELGEKYSSVLKQMIIDGVKVGMALGELIRTKITAPIKE